MMANYDSLPCELEHVVQAGENWCPYCSIDSKDELIEELVHSLKVARLKIEQVEAWAMSRDEVLKRRTAEMKERMRKNSAC